MITLLGEEGIAPDAIQRHGWRVRTFMPVVRFMLVTVAVLGLWRSAVNARAMYANLQPPPSRLTFCIPSPTFWEQTKGMAQDAMLPVAAGVSLMLVRKRGHA